MTAGSSIGSAGRKSILITGAASGIGRATALLFAQHGWFVGAYDVTQPGLAALEAEIGAGAGLEPAAGGPPKRPPPTGRVGG